MQSGGQAEKYIKCLPDRLSLSHSYKDTTIVYTNEIDMQMDTDTWIQHVSSTVCREHHTTRSSTVCRGHHTKCWSTVCRGNHTTCWSTTGSPRNGNRMGTDS